MTPDVVTTLDRMIASPTVSSRPIRELAAYVASRCEDLGLRVEVFEDPDDPTKASVIATAGPADADPEGDLVRGGLAISGHMDVVPVEGQPWSSDPFQLTERGGALYGRGTADMKGFIAATLSALARLDLDALRRQLVLIWTHDEEVGCLGSAKLTRWLEADGRPLPDEALIGEPTGFQILRMHPGHVGVEVVATGRAAHSSKPDLGSSAIKAMTRALVSLEALEAELKRERRLEAHLERPFVAFNAATLRAGQAINIVPDRCALQLGYRPLPGDDPLAVARRIEERLAALSLPEGTGLSSRVLRVTPAMLTPEDQPLAGLLAPHACAGSGCAASFATDGGNLQRLGMRSLIFGPGSIDVAHMADEHVSIEALHRAVDVVEDVVRRRCG